MLEQRDGPGRPDAVVVLAIPLLKAAHRETSASTRWWWSTARSSWPLDRLVEQRGMDRADAEARIAAQITREDRLAEADFVLDNSSTGAPRRRGGPAVALAEARPPGRHRLSGQPA